MGLIFGDESDTSRSDQRNVFVYAFLLMSYPTYEEVEDRFWGLKRAKRILGEVKWTAIPAYRETFLEMLAVFPVRIHYYVWDKSSGRLARPDRYRYKVLEAAFSSLLPAPLAGMPLILLDQRHEKQNREEAKILMALGTKWQSPVPPYAYLPSDLVVGLQLADLVVGALRAHESRGDTTWEILKPVTTRVSV